MCTYIINKNTDFYLNTNDILSIIESCNTCLSKLDLSKCNSNNSSINFRLSKINIFIRDFFYENITSSDEYNNFIISSTCGTINSKFNFSDRSRINELLNIDWITSCPKSDSTFLGLFWDFINGYPKIIACFYSDKLDIDDWNFIHRKELRLSPVHIINHKGKSKIFPNWMAVLNNDTYLHKLSNSKFIGYNPKDIL